MNDSPITMEEFVRLLQAGLKWSGLSQTQVVERTEGAVSFQHFNQRLLDPSYKVPKKHIRRALERGLGAPVGYLDGLVALPGENVAAADTGALLVKEPTMEGLAGAGTEKYTPPSPSIPSDPGQRMAVEKTYARVTAALAIAQRDGTPLSHHLVQRDFNDLLEAAQEDVQRARQSSAAERNGKTTR